MKEREKSRMKLVTKELIAGGIVAGALLLGVGVFAINNSNIQKRQELLANSPLQQTTMWYSLDEYPEYKYEAALEADKLIKAGTPEDEACATVIENTSDKIYKDTVKFIEQNPDLSGDEYDKAYSEYVAATQK